MKNLRFFRLAALLLIAALSFFSTSNDAFAQKKKFSKKDIKNAEPFDISKLNSSSNTGSSNNTQTNGNTDDCTNKSERLCVGEQKTITVHANHPFNWTDLLAKRGDKYQFSVEDAYWSSAGRHCNANGFESNSAALRFEPSSRGRCMRLVVEFFANNRDEGSFVHIARGLGTGTRGGTNAPLDPGNINFSGGYMMLMANDAPLFYWDNAGEIGSNDKKIGIVRPYPATTLIFSY